MSNLNNILFPIISDPLLKKGKNKIGKAIFLNVNLSKFSSDLIWSKKLTPKAIGHKDNLFDLSCNF